MSDTPFPRPGGLTYADAGVDIDAGEMLVDAIKPLAKATARPGMGKNCLAATSAKLIRTEP